MELLGSFYAYNFVPNYKPFPARPNIYTHIKFHMHFSSPLNYYMPSPAILYLPKRTDI